MSKSIQIGFRMLVSIKRFTNESAVLGDTYLLRADPQKNAFLKQLSKNVYN